MKIRSIALLLAGLAVMVAGIVPGQAESTSDDAIARMLSGVRTRQLSGTSVPSTAPAAATADTALIDNVRKQLTGRISADQRNKIYDLASGRPAVELDIQFDTGSAQISPQSMDQFEQLGRALSRPEFKDAVFLVAGHTDAVGNDRYNMILSERRAASVKAALVSKFRIPADRLVAVGYGQSHLKASDPNAAENRRVQVVNMNPQIASR